MPRDDRTYIRVHDGMPDHPKMVGLPAAAKWAIVETWCYCSRYLTDGFVPAAKWRQIGTPAIRKQLIDGGLVDAAPATPGAVIVHDYDQHQRTATEVDAYKERKKTAGALGNHNRWHEGKKVDPNCPICIANVSQLRLGSDA